MKREMYICKKIKFVFLLYCCLGLFYLSSCINTDINKNIEISNDSIINPDILVEIMTEIFLIEATVYQEKLINSNSNVVNEITEDYYDFLLKKYNISKREIENSISYYLLRREIEEIYQKVIENLMEMEILENEVVEK